MVIVERKGKEWQKEKKNTLDVASVTGTEKRSVRVAHAPFHSGTIFLLRMSGKEVQYNKTEGNEKTQVGQTFLRAFIPNQGSGCRKTVGARKEKERERDQQNKKKRRLFFEIPLA